MDTLMVPVAQVKDAKNKRIDIKSGEIYLMQNIDGHPIKHKMYMKVFRSDYEHHAQIYTDAGYVFLNDVLSLRNCDVKVDKDLKRITISGDNISIRSVAADKVVLLEVNSLVEIMEWEQSLKPSSGLLLDSEFSPQTSPTTQKRNTEF